MWAGKITEKKKTSCIQLYRRKFFRAINKKNENEPTTNGLCKDIG